MLLSVLSACTFRDVSQTESNKWSASPANDNQNQNARTNRSHCDIFAAQPTYAAKRKKSSLRAHKFDHTKSTSIVQGSSSSSIIIIIIINRLHSHSLETALNSSSLAAADDIGVAA
jgi:hypothetical protein